MSTPPPLPLPFYPFPSLSLYSQDHRERSLIIHPARSPGLCRGARKQLQTPYLILSPRFHNPPCTALQPSKLKLTHPQPLPHHPLPFNDFQTTLPFPADFTSSQNTQTARFTIGETVRGNGPIRFLRSAGPGDEPRGRRGGGKGSTERKARLCPHRFPECTIFQGSRLTRRRTISHKARAPLPQNKNSNPTQSETEKKD